MVFLLVEEVLLEEDEVGGEEDVVAEGREEGVEVRGGGWAEYGEGAYGFVFALLVSC